MMLQRLKIFFIVLFIFSSCKHDSNKLNTIAIISKKNFQFETFIFFEQDTIIGSVKIQDANHYFEVRNKIQIFFIKEKIGDGCIKYFERNNKQLKEVYYNYPMGKKDWNDKSFQIFGGSLRSISNFSKKKKIRYLTFKSDYVAQLKNNLEIPEEKVIKIYNSIYKNDILTTEDLYPDGADMR